MYTNWEQDGSKQWETFLATELPNWLAANKGLAPGGHGIVGASQGGYGAMAMATFHPDRYRFAGSLSGFLAPERTGVDGAITAGLAAVRRCGHPQHVGIATAGPVEVALAERPCAASFGQQHPAVGVQPDDRRVRRARDDRLLRYRRRHEQGVLPALPLRRRCTTATSTSQPAAAMTGAPGAGSSPRCRANWSPRSSRQQGRPRPALSGSPWLSAGTLEPCSSR